MSMKETIGDAGLHRTVYRYGRTRLKRYTIGAVFALLSVIVIGMVYGPETPAWFRVLPLVMLLAVLVLDLLRPWRVSIQGETLIVTGLFTRVNCPLSATEVVVANLPGHQPPWQEITLKCNGKSYRISADIEGFLELGAALGIERSRLRPHFLSKEFQEARQASKEGPRSTGG